MLVISFSFFSYIFYVEVPLFWSQSPYSLHPVPTLERTEEENMHAFEKHFKTQENLYGKQIIVNLTELVGREAIVGAQYRKHIEELGDPNIKYVNLLFLILNVDA